MLHLFIIGFVIGIVSIIGVVNNLALIYIVWKIKKLKNAFYLLTVSLAVFDGFFSFLYLIYVTPVTALKIQFMEDIQISSICGFLLMTLFVSATFSHTIITFNRFFAVSIPIVYRKVFSFDKTILVILANVIFATMINFVFLFLGCGLFYNPENHSFEYTASFLVCKIYNDGFNLYTIFALSILHFLIDLITMKKLQKIIENRQKSSKSTFTAKTDMGYLKQAMAQTLFIFFNLCIFLFAFSSIVKNPDYGFVVTSLGWLTLQALDGILTFIFNNDIKKYFFGKSNYVGPSSSVGNARRI